MIRPYRKYEKMTFRREESMDRGINTRCLHLKETEGKSENYGAISYPIYQTSTYAHPGVGKSTGYDYTIDGAVWARWSFGCWIRSVWWEHSTVW